MVSKIEITDTHKEPMDLAAHVFDGDAPIPEAPGAEHGAGHEGRRAPELENFWNLLAKSPLNKEGTITHSVIKHFDPYVEDAHAARVHSLTQNVFFSFVTVAVVIWLVRRCVRKRAMIPDRAQSAAELVIEGLSNFFLSILGEKHGPRYIPFLLGLFLFILCNNLMGLVPFMKSSTSAFECNIGLGVCVFLYAQYTGLRYNGPKRYILHFMGNPETVVQWVLAPFLLVLELISELVKPISLSLRLFGNILGEDILLGVLAMLGVMMTAFLLKPIGIEHPIVGLPLQLPFLFLATLSSAIQALIFTLLSCIYILLMLPHEEVGH